MTSGTFPRAVVLAVALAGVSVEVPEAFQCASCIHESARRATTVVLDFDGPSFNVETWREAAAQWTASFDNAGSNVTVTVGGGANWIIRLVEPSAMPGAWGDAPPGGVIYIRSDALTKGPGFIKWLFTHEIGHTLGFMATTCPVSDSVMANRQPDPGQPGGVSGTTSLGCAMNAHIQINYVPEPIDYCANGCTPGYAPMGSPGCSEASIDECGCCLTYSPIVLDLAADGVQFSAAANGPLFTINDMGRQFRLGWPESADDVWLWLDRNANGVVDNGGELFGNATRLASGRPAPNGFVALAELDSDGDGRIDFSDAAFDTLQIWSDRNRDGVSQHGEISYLRDTEVVAIELAYRESNRRDAHGNVFRYRAVFHLSGVKRRTWAWDVYPDVETRGAAGVCATPMSVRELRPSFR